MLFLPSLLVPNCIILPHLNIWLWIIPKVLVSVKQGADFIQQWLGVISVAECFQMSVLMHLLLQGLSNHAWYQRVKWLCICLASCFIVTYFSWLITVLIQSPIVFGSQASISSRGKYWLFMKTHRCKKQYLLNL